MNKSKFVEIRFVTLLSIVFTVLKLTNVIKWSWLWVLSPIWISWGVYALIMTAIVIKTKH